MIKAVLNNVIVPKANKLSQTISINSFYNVYVNKHRNHKTVNKLMSIPIY